MSEPGNRHALWRMVKNNVSHLERHAPQGYDRVVDVFVEGRAEPIRLGVVETSSTADVPWALFQPFASGDAPEGSYDSDVRLVFAQIRTPCARR